MCAISKNKLTGGDLRSISGSNDVVDEVKNQQDFDALFELIFSSDRLLAMRSIDAVEKITKSNPAYIQTHKNALLKLLPDAEHKEFKWHLAQLVSRFTLSKKEAGKTWQILSNWAQDKKESRIVRVSALQAMYDILKQYPKLRPDFEQIIGEVSTQNIPSINARIKQFK